MTIKPKQQTAQPSASKQSIADALRQKKAKDIQPLERLIFQVCTWKPVQSDYRAGKVRQISDLERAHLRTQKLLQHITFKLLFKQALFNLKTALYAPFKKKR